jgi:putative membrane protein
VYTRKTIRITKAGALAVAVLALTGGAAGRALAAPGASAGGAHDDVQIVRRVLALNRAEERSADEVKGKLVSTAVWQLAERISVDDAALDQKFESLAPGDRPSDRAGAAGGRPERPDLSNLSGDDLEKAYVDREVESHQAMLATIDGELIPAAKGEELQRRLIDLRAEVAAHLQAAENVQHAEWVRQTAEQQRTDIEKEIGNRP